MDFDAQTEQFLAWLRARGVQMSPKIELADLRAQNQGRGVVATAPIAADEVLFSVPVSAVLTSRDLAEGSRDAHDQDEWTALVVRMMRAASSEEWKPYFDCFPRTFNTPMFWTEQETAALLQGSEVVKRIGRDEALRAHADLQAAAPADLRDASLDLFHRCASLIMAYAFDLEQEVQGASDDEDGLVEVEAREVKAMVPLADMLNAHTRLHNAHLCAPDDLAEPGAVLQMVATKPIAAGEQVYNTYGSISSAELLRRYGYVEGAHAAYEVFEFDTAAVLGAAAGRLHVAANELRRRVERLESLYGAPVADEHHMLYDFEDGELQLLSEELVLLLSALERPSLDKKQLRECVRAEEKGRLGELGVGILLDVLDARQQTYKDVPALPPALADAYTAKEDMCNHVLRMELDVLGRAREALQLRRGQLASKKQKTEAR